MGRPALNIRSSNVRLDPEILARIDALVGKGRRSEFIRRAIEQYVEAIEFARELEQRGK